MIGDFSFLFYFILEREGERKQETHRRVCLRGSDPPPTYVSPLESEPTTMWCIGQRSIQPSHTGQGNLGPLGAQVEGGSLFLPGKGLPLSNPKGTATFLYRGPNFQILGAPSSAPGKGPGPHFLPEVRMAWGSR